jgi:MoaA/NifB/PqqE/SkfB family radical SAM enzyme
MALLGYNGLEMTMRSTQDDPQSFLRTVRTKLRDYRRWNLTHSDAAMDTWEFKPHRLNLQVTNRCNHRCLSCSLWQEPSRDRLSTEEIISFVDDASRQTDLQNISFTGGEPMLRRDILDLVRHAASTAPEVVMSSNGELLRTEEDCENLIRAGLTGICLSYHGMGVHGEFTRTRGAEQKVRESVRLLKGMAARLDRKISIQIGTLVTRWSLPRFDEMLRYCEEEGIGLYPQLPDLNLPPFRESEVRGILVDNPAEIERFACRLTEWLAAGRPLSLVPQAIPFIRRYLSGEKIVSPCPLSLHQLYLNAAGDVHAGCWVLPPVGNIKNEALEDITGSRVHRQRIREVSRRQCQGCSCGYPEMALWYVPYIAEAFTRSAKLRLRGLGTRLFGNGTAP